MSQRLRGKRVIVTGGGSGIGRAAALKLAEEGAGVAVLDVHSGSAKQTTDQIVGDGGDAIALTADVANETQVADAIDQAEEHFGRLDTVIANAGIFLFGKDAIATELTLEVWKQCVDVNLTGMFLT